MASGETLSGGSFTATISGISNINNVVIKDNDVDVTSLFTKQGNNYVRTYDNVDSDHTITVEEKSSPYTTKKSYVKKNDIFKETVATHFNSGGSWLQKNITKVFWKIGTAWTETTTESMSGRTAFKMEV